MSRLIVKNLPPNITESELKEHFSTKGVVTDVQLKYTKDGKFRRFGFIGFKSEDQAQTALNYFDKTFIKTTQINVQLCSNLGDDSKPKSWSKYAPDRVEVKDSTNQLKKTKKVKDEADEIKQAISKFKDEPLFNEFLASHSADEITKLLANSEDSNSVDDKTTLDEDLKTLDLHSDTNIDKKSTKIANEKISDLDYLEVLKGKKPLNLTEKSSEQVTTPGKTKFYTVKVRGLGYNHKKKHIKQFFQSLKPKSIRVPRNIKGIAFVGFKTERLMNQALNKDRTFFEGKQLFVSKYEKTEKTVDEPKDEKKDCRWKEQELALKNEEPIAESGRMFVRNLCYTVKEEDLRKIFEKYGPLAELDLPVDLITRKPKGFAYVTFLMPEHAAKAYSELDGTALSGRTLHILPGKSKSSITDRLQEEGLSFKEKQEIKKRGSANLRHNWNTLFLGQNAVVDAIASTYNTTKDKILDDDVTGTSVAVRLALGETQLVEETKKFLENNGVRLDAFNQPTDKRSNTVILVKNLPANTRVSELREKFAVYGQLDRVIMPPSGITALVEFLVPSEARKAFTRLAYTKFKNLPLYLEWAPDQSLAPNENPSKNLYSSRENAQTKPEDDQSTSKDDEDEPEPDTTIFVKNLNFSTMDDALKAHFNKCGEIYYANVVMKKVANKPGEKLSMGYGFVRYKYKSSADRALKELQMSELDGKTLELKRSERTLPSDVPTARKISSVTSQTGTKILIKNIPFQANANEITELFKAFGELIGVRLPKKLVGDEKHRGFGFVEFHTKSDAKKAFNALCQSTHLYGRRLVLEWAQGAEDVADIRKRTAKHFHQENGDNKRKKATLDPESVGLATD